VDARDLSTVNADGSRAVEAGDYMLHLGGSQPTEGDTVNASFTIRGSKELPR
jgi:beta-glucosidase